MASVINTASVTGTIRGGASVKGTIQGGTELRGTIEIGGINVTPYVLPPATTGTLGGVIVGQDLLVTEEGVLSVDKATSAEEDNTRPITAAAVYTEIGNINALLATI